MTFKSQTSNAQIVTQRIVMYMIQGGGMSLIAVENSGKLECIAEHRRQVTTIRFDIGMRV